MNLINKKVTHKSFGVGSIVKQSDTSIEIHFATESKKFVFPDVFEKHLTLHDKSDANSLENIIQMKAIKRKDEEQKKEEEGILQRKNKALRIEHKRLIDNHKLHPESQLVFWCDAEEQKNVFSEWKVFSGVSKSGNNKGKPTKPVRLFPNSAVLLTTVDPDKLEKDRRIIGAYMVKEDFIGKLSEDGNIPAHATYRLQLTEQEADQLLFWTYYVNEKSPHKMTWNTGKHRYFNNVWMAQILNQIVSLKSDQKEREAAYKFFEYFCKVNKIAAKDLPKVNGALTRI